MNHFSFDHKLESTFSIDERKKVPLDARLLSDAKDLIEESWKQRK